VADFVSRRRLRYAFETRAPPAPRAAAMDTQASERRGCGSAGGTGVGVATGAQWGLREAGSRCWAKGAFRDLGIAQRWAARASAVARVRCVVRSWAPRRAARPRYLATGPRATAKSGAGDRRPTGPPTRRARTRPRNREHTGSVQASSGLYKLVFCQFWWFSWSIFGCLIESTGHGSLLI